jgi:hypothetical protein
MFPLLLNTVCCVLMAAMAVHSVVLHARLRRFRHVLAEVGQMLPTLDASVERMTEVASGFSQRLQGELETVEGRVATARRLGSELTDANRAAEAAAAHLERLLRQHRQIEAARAAAQPRELVEPKGFAERFGGGVIATAADRATATPPAPSDPRGKHKRRIAAL